MAMRIITTASYVAYGGLKREMLKQQQATSTCISRPRPKLEAAYMIYHGDGDMGYGCDMTVKPHSHSHGHKATAI
jgi:hypothetical protein